MGTDDFFKKKRQARQKRKCELKIPKANSFLIVTEGAKTEPLYLNGIEKQIKESIGGRVDVKIIPQIDVHGEGKSTNKLIDKTSEIIRKTPILYQEIWVVFDKDDFQDFDQAIERGNTLGYNIAWSNECFEYWAYLHFEYSDAALHRNDWQKKLDAIFEKYGLGDGKYSKNNPEIYNLLNTFDGVSTAIKNAKRRMSNFNDTQDKPSLYNPGTKMHVLVEKLLTYVM